MPLGRARRDLKLVSPGLGVYAILAEDQALGLVSWLLCLVHSTG
jgi:hypothetical protein